MLGKQDTLRPISSTIVCVFTFVVALCANQGMAICGFSPDAGSSWSTAGSCGVGEVQERPRSQLRAVPRCSAPPGGLEASSGCGGLCWPGAELAERNLGDGLSWGRQVSTVRPPFAVKVDES